jgi:hypothetical protein
VHSAEQENEGDTEQFDGQSMAKEPGKEVAVPHLCPTKASVGQVDRAAEEKHDQAAPTNPAKASPSLTDQRYGDPLVFWSARDWNHHQSQKNHPTNPNRYGHEVQPDGQEVERIHPLLLLSNCPDFLCFCEDSQ